MQIGAHSAQHRSRNMTKRPRGQGRKSRKPAKRKTPVKLLAVGHDVIDAGHETIGECCDRIAESDSGALEAQLQRLRSLLAHHFQNEELLLKAAGSSLCGCHALDHRIMLALCDRAIRSATDGDGKSRKVIIKELVPALRKHIAYRDQLIALYLNTLDTPPVLHS